MKRRCDEVPKPDALMGVKAGLSDVGFFALRQRDGREREGVTRGNEWPPLVLSPSFVPFIFWAGRSPCTGTWFSFPIWHARPDISSTESHNRVMWLAVSGPNVVR